MNNLLNYSSWETQIIIYLIIINIISFLLFGIDKRRAKRKLWRVSEKVLLATSLLGGATGALIAMVIFKHKLSKKSFYIGVPVLIVLNKIAMLWLFRG